MVTISCTIDYDCALFYYGATPWRPWDDKKDVDNLLVSKTFVYLHCLPHDE